MRRRLVEGPGSIGERARARRAERFLSTFLDLERARVLDLGGTLPFWQQLPIKPRSVTTLNVAGSHQAEVDLPWFRDVVGDACSPPDEIRSAAYDLVFSNSTIEHVGGPDRRRQFAAVVHEMAPRHWIQTPNRAFPVEPHVLFPLEQFLPRVGRALIHRYWPLVHSNSSSMERALKAADATELIGRSELATLFPDSVIAEERVAPLLPAKSLIAIAT